MHPCLQAASSLPNRAVEEADSHECNASVRRMYQTHASVSHGRNEREERMRDAW